MNRTSIFANCSKHYDLEPLFESCVNATHPCESIAAVETAVVIIYVDYYSSTVLFSIAILVNLYLLVVAVPLFRRMQDDSRKKYVFLLSRCSSSATSAVAWLLVQCIYIRFLPPIPANYPLYVIALTLYDASIYGMLGSYVGTSLLLYVGVFYPTAFHQRIRLSAVYMTVTIIYGFSFGLSIPLAIYQAAISIPGTIDCSNSRCGPLISLINFILISGALFITISILSFVLFSVHKHKRRMEKSETTSLNSSLNSAIHLISWTLGGILLITIAEVIPYVVAENKNKEDVGPSCHDFDRSSTVIVEASLTMFLSDIWGIALIIDPLANILFDVIVSRHAVDQIKWVANKIARRSMQKSEVCQTHTIDSHDAD